MNIKRALKTNTFTKKWIEKYKEKNEKKQRKLRLQYHGKFIDRSTKKDKLCIVLAGYKDFLYPAVFGRLERYVDDDIDVCIITSGKWVEEINKLCEKNQWSYLSTKENDVSLVQNVAISLHPSAKYIYKLDEDIFITKNYFTKMYNAFHDAKKGPFNPGVVAPILPINGYGHVRILKKLKLEKEYERKFGKIKYSTTTQDKIQKDPEVAKFFWGKGGVVPSIDYMNSLFEKDDIKEVACPIRFSIGAILFQREFWEAMGYFRVVPGTNSLGVDEADMCNYCCFNSRPLMVSENIVVGHLSFGPQNNEMKKYYMEHQDVFL